MSEPDFPGCGTAYGAFTVPVNQHRQTGDAASVLYFIQSGDLVKVGIASNLQRRLREITLGNPHPLVVKSRSIPRALARQVERQAHEALAEFAVGREWFRVSQAEAIRAAKPIIARAWTAAHRMNMDGAFLGLR